MRVEDHRVRPLDTPEQGTTRGNEQEEPAVGGVAVVPEALGAGDVGDGVQGIHRAGVRRPGPGGDEPGAEAVALVLSHLAGERLRGHAPGGVHRDDAAGRFADAGEVDRLPHRVVRLVGDIDHGAREVRALESVRVPRGDDRGDAGDAAAGRQVPAGGRRIPDQRSEPVHQAVLEDHRSR